MAVATLLTVAAPDSIATMYRLLAWTLARGRPCLACGRHGGHDS
jgi:hypothetical protein